MTKTANTNRNDEQSINELDEKVCAGSAQKQERVEKNAHAGKPNARKTGRPTQNSQLPIPWRRRNDTSSLQGLIREHGRLLSWMHQGKIGLDAGESLSRTYIRQHDLVSKLEYITYIAGIEERLRQMQAETSMRTVSQVDFNTMAETDK